LNPNIIFLDEWLKYNEKGSTWCKSLKANLPAIVELDINLLKINGIHHISNDEINYYCPFLKK
jgi:hypothetical protein